ncbi:MAG: anti-repressor (endogenous virus) [Lactobacillus phage ViSo-2018a]|uniref:Antirepressor protein n=1 Tax=Lactobacillus phage ViSo-2018a TaxID=2267607 RepID=A0A3G6JHG0_9CAUD|nr:MAG: anti-repressor [Lactobacillus phage ViSo-2018a]AZA17301.1 MAG: antirepressor protein [Lactobacillus phage ViSo-2018a]
MLYLTSFLSLNFCTFNKSNSKLVIFNFEGNQVRTIEIDIEPWFVGKDVASILGYKKPQNALATHIDEEDKTTSLIQGTGSNYKSKAVIINESGLCGHAFLFQRIKKVS